ncbi:P-loop NTPase fold protein [Polyangium fumosum]|uniref:ATP-binding protein n=1 Tax=Polyangium fumosum TaxID=889272 RepID=A0A4U1J8U5_9BACT|nr:P-loop NTPase fold protein [Polyangium fumosum]TKD03833.1 ATP-binding protein [Polyangium fumosum]
MQTAPIALRELQHFVKQCDPNQPLDPGDSRYVDLDAGAPVRGASGARCIDHIERTIVFNEPTSPVCLLFTGFPGSGKTTELRRLQKRLEENKQTPFHVLMVDFQDYRTDPTPLSILETLRVLAYELDRAATRAEGRDPDQEPGYLKRFYDFLKTTQIDLKGLGFAQLGATLMFEAKGNHSFRKQLEDALATRFQVFVQDAREAMAEAVVRLRRATHAQQIVVLVDGLEKVTPLREEDRETLEASAETVFVEHAARLRLPCHVVYTFPLWLRFRHTQLDSFYHRPAQILPMIKVADPDGGTYAPGYAKLTELVGRRLELKVVFGEDRKETLDKLIAASGGYTRDLLRMVREVLWSAPAFPVDPETIRQIIDRTAEGYVMAIRDNHADLLSEIARTHELPHGDDGRVAVFGRLLQLYLVLAYRNGKPWYDLHPLVRDAPIVKARLAGTKA